MKQNPSDLAILGGEPIFRDKVHVGRPNVGDRKRLFERFEEMLDRCWFSNDGPLVQEFEDSLEKFIGVRHAIAVCNATIGLELVTRALGLTGEVIVPSFTFVATAHCLEWQGITPVFCDIDQHTHCIDPLQVEKLITPQTTGIIGVHLWGRPCAIEALTVIAERHDLALIFDAAHAFASSHRGRMIGGFGRAEVFSFHATKFFNTFEGGAIVTDDDELAGTLRLMKNFGFQGYDNVTRIGTNGKMVEAAAAMGLTGLESLDHFIAINRRNYEQYAHELSATPGIRLISYDQTEACNFQYVVLEILSGDEYPTRDQLVAILHAENVLARRYFYPGCHRMEPYRSRDSLLQPDLHVTDAVSSRVMSLPTGSAVGAQEITKICQTIRYSFENGSAIVQKLAGRSQIVSRDAL